MSRNAVWERDRTGYTQGMATVAYGMLGTTLDRMGARRWDRWRPTVGLCQQDDLLIDKLVLLHPARSKRLGHEVQQDIATVSPETSVELVELSFRNPWDFEEVYGKLYAFLQTQTFRPSRDDYLVHITTGTHVAQICWFLLTESRHIPARLVQTSPSNQKEDVAGRADVIDLDLSKYDALWRRFAKEREDALTFLKSGIATRNEAFNAQIEQIERVALSSKEPMLLMGPTGAGKSHLASRIYELKNTRHQTFGDFVEVNCATLRGDGAMSALFGHKKGAFTGASTDRAGLLKKADKGLLFLDEIGELGLDEQAMLLRALEDKRFLPLGADKEVDSDFQLIAGTNRDLSERVAEGGFRDDLLARIDVWTFRLPGLRDRIEDLEPNLVFELDRFEQRYRGRVTFNKSAKARYLSFATSPHATWAGNFRDLNKSVTRMATLAQGGRIDDEVVQGEIERLAQSWAKTTPLSDAQKFARDLLGDEAWADIDPFDQPQLAHAVFVCRQAKSLSEAGRTLFAVSRQKRRSTNDADRLRKYLARFGLSYSQIQEAS